VQDPQEDIALMRPDGTDFHRLTNDSYQDRVPRWTADGSAIIFVSNRDGRSHRWSIRRDGSDLHPVNAVANPAVAPSGIPAEITSPVWSEDHKEFAGWLPSEAPGVRPFVVGLADGSGMWVVGDRAFSPTWLKDGAGLLYFEQNEIRFADVRSRTVHRVFSRPDVDVHGKFALAPDERTIFFVMMEDQEDVWIAEQD
jgi:hypothetical protein